MIWTHAVSIFLYNTFIIFYCLIISAMLCDTIWAVFCTSIPRVGPPWSHVLLQYRRRSACPPSPEDPPPFTQDQWSGSNVIVLRSLPLKLGMLPSQWDHLWPQLWRNKKMVPSKFHVYCWTESQVNLKNSNKNVLQTYSTPAKPLSLVLILIFWLKDNW